MANVHNVQNALETGIDFSQANVKALSKEERKILMTAFKFVNGGTKKVPNNLDQQVIDIKKKLQPSSPQEETHTLGKFLDNIGRASNTKTILKEAQKLKGKKDSDIISFVQNNKKNVSAYRDKVKTYEMRLDAFQPNGSHAANCRIQRNELGKEQEKFSSGIEKLHQQVKSSKDSVNLIEEKGLEFFKKLDEALDASRQLDPIGPQQKIPYTKEQVRTKFEDATRSLNEYESALNAQLDISQDKLKKYKI